MNSIEGFTKKLKKFVGAKAPNTYKIAIVFDGVLKGKTTDPPKP